MKHIKLFEEALANSKDPKEMGINPSLLWAYRDARESGNELIDFNEVIWEKDIEEILKGLKENNFDAFTISSTFSGLSQTIAAFEEQGCKLAGMTEVNSRFKDWQTGEPETLPAFLIEVETGHKIT